MPDWLLIVVLVAAFPISVTIVYALNLKSKTVKEEDH